MTLLRTSQRMVSPSSSLLRQKRIQTLSSNLLKAFATQSRPALVEEKKQSSSSQSLFQAAPLSPSAPPPKKHSPFKAALVKTLAKLMGYNSTTSTAIRVTSDLFDRCAERADLEADFWYKECNLPRTYQIWFQITNLHVHLLLVRFRMLLPEDKAQSFSQELINHFFIDAESRMRLRFGVQTSRLVKGYLRDVHNQQRGAVLGLDEAIAKSAVGESDREALEDADAALATAIWRNIWGAGGWGQGVAGVKRKLKGVDRPDEQKSDGREANTSESVQEMKNEEGKPELARDLGMETSGRGSYAIAAAQLKAQVDAREAANDLVPPEPRFPSDNLRFANNLQRVVTFYRREMSRLSNLSDEEVVRGHLSSNNAATGKGSNSVDTHEGVRINRVKRTDTIANFSRI